jgi:hypothetical protein
MFAAMEAAIQISQPYQDLLRNISAAQLFAFQRLMPVVEQLASQRLILNGLGNISLGLRVDQATQAWRLAAKPQRQPTSELVKSESLEDVAFTAASINATAGVIEGEIVGEDDEPWIVARTEAVDGIVMWLSEIHPKLGAKFKGMWHVVYHRGPDFVSQAANSAMELIDHTLRTLGPDNEVLAWRQLQGKYASEVNEKNNRPHRSLRIRYIATQRGLRPSSVELLVRATSGLVDDLQELKHAGEDRMVLALSNALQAVEYCLLTLMRDEIQ